MSLKILEAHIRVNATELSEQLSSSLRVGVNETEDKRKEGFYLLKTMDDCASALASYQRHMEVGE